MVARRSKAVAEIEPQAYDPIADIQNRATEDAADAAAGILDDLAGSMSANAELIIYKVAKDGTWGFIKRLTPPIDSISVLEELRDDWGGGNYQFRVRANGRIVTTKSAPIAGVAKLPSGSAPVVSQDSGIKDMLPLLMSSGDKSMQMMMAMMAQQAQQSQNQMQMMMQSGQQQTQMLMGILPLLVGGKPDIVQMLELMKGNKSDTPMSEMVQTMIALKGLMGDGGGGDEDTSMLGMIKAALPMLGKVVEAQANANPGPLSTNGPPQPLRPPAPPMRIPQIPPARGVVPPPLAGLEPNPIRPPEVSFDRPAYLSDPVLSVIGEDVLFYARRGAPVDMAAEMILDRIEKAQIKETDLNALVVRFTTSADWLADLAAAGLDLRPYKTWADEFLPELIQQYTEAASEGDDSEGPGGGEGHAGGDGEASAGGS